MGAPRKYPDELQGRAIRLAVEGRRDPASRPNACRRIEEQLSVHHETMRGRAMQAEGDRGARPGTRTADAARILDLERQNRELVAGAVTGGIRRRRQVARRRPRLLLAALALATVTSSAACSPRQPAATTTTTATAPVLTAVPTTAPTTVRAAAAPGDAAACSVPATARPSASPATERAAGSEALGLVSVDPNPVAATLVWLPGENATTCTTRLTVLGAPAARRLAHDLLTAPAAPPGPVACPSDDAAAVVAYLRYAQRTRAEVATIDLSGCAFIDAPAHRARQQSARLRRDLRAAAPAEWASYLREQ